MGSIFWAPFDEFRHVVPQEIKTGKLRDLQCVHQFVNHAWIAFQDPGEVIAGCAQPNVEIQRRRIKAETVPTKLLWLRENRLTAVSATSVASGSGVLAISRKSDGAIAAKKVVTTSSRKKSCVLSRQFRQIGESLAPHV